MSISDASLRSVSLSSLFPGNIISDTIKNRYRNIFEENISYTDKTPQDLALDNLTNALRWYDIVDEPTVLSLAESVSKFFRLRFFNSIITAGALIFMWRHKLDIENNRQFFNLIVSKIIDFYEGLGLEKSKKLTKELVPLMSLELISYMKAISDYKSKR